MGQWLVHDFVVFGIHFQNWMPFAVVLVVVLIVYTWLTER
jgi:hypothetical protein